MGSEIAAASTEQAEGIGQIKTAVVQVDGIAQQSAAAAQESARASLVLREQVEQVSLRA